MLALRSLRSIYRLSRKSTPTSSSFFHTSNYYRDDQDTGAKDKQKQYGKYRFGTGGPKRRDKQAKQELTSALVKFGHSFDEVPRDQRNKENFQNAIGLYLQKNVHRRGQVEFIYAALKYMKEFGVARDIECYKALLHVFPKGKMIAENYYQLIMKHYPKHQDCCIDVLDQMQHHELCPDKEMVMIVENAFGKWSQASLKLYRMMYWMPKFRYINPYKAPDPLPRAPLELAKLAIQRMCRDPANQIYVWYTDAMPNPPEKTWIVCGQSCHQQQLITEHKETAPIYVDGPFREWIWDENVSYFVLLADSRPDKHYHEIYAEEPETSEDWASWTTKFNTEFPESRKALMKAATIHEQSDGTILSIAVTGSSSKDSLVCWIQFLQKLNPKLEKIPVVFRMAHGIGDLVVRKKDDESENAVDMNVDQR